jgi:hypothetical protein
LDWLFSTDAAAGAADFLAGGTFLVAAGAAAVFDAAVFYAIIFFRFYNFECKVLKGLFLKPVSVNYSVISSIRFSFVSARNSSGTSFRLRLDVSIATCCGVGHIEGESLNERLSFVVVV